MMKCLFFVILALAIITQVFAYADHINCYECSRRGFACDIKHANTIKCPINGHCFAQWPKGGNINNATRTCIIVYSEKPEFPCLGGYECKACKEDLCNVATAHEFAPMVWAGLFYSLLYLN